MQNIVVSFLQGHYISRCLDMIVLVEWDHKLHRVKVSPQPLHRALAVLQLAEWVETYAMIWAMKGMAMVAVIDLLIVWENASTFLNSAIRR